MSRDDAPMRMRYRPGAACQLCEVVSHVEKDRRVSAIVTRVLEAGRGFLAGTPTQVAAAYGGVIALAFLFSLWALRGLRKAEAAG